MLKQSDVRPLLVIVLMNLWVGHGRGAEPQLLAPIIVTGSRLPQPETSATQSIVVLPEREIRDRAPATLSELLRYAASLHVDQPGAPGGFAALYLRGSDPSQTVIMIDGVKVGDPTNARGGSMDLSLIDPWTIARVEILPGASSAIYGADAMAGVVNIITRQPQRAGLRVDAGIGGDGYLAAFASGNVRSEGVALHAQGATRSDGHRADTAFARLRTGSLRVETGQPGQRHLMASVRVQHQESAAFPEDSGGSVFAVKRQLEQRNADGVVAALNGEGQTSWGSMRVYSNLFNQDAQVESPGVAPGIRDSFGLPRTSSASLYRRWAVGAIAEMRSGEGVPALIGVQYEKERGEVLSTLFFGPTAVPANFTVQRHTRSVFAEGRTSLGEKITARGGWRVDDTETHGAHTTVNAGLAYQPQESDVRLAFNYGTGFKPPSFFALGHPIVGNTQLKPEGSRTLEASVASDRSTKAAHPLMYRVALFRSQFDNLVDFDPGPPPKLVNRSEVVIKGYDASASVRAMDNLSLKAAITGLSFGLPPGAPPLRSRPLLRATAGASYRAVPQLTTSVYSSWVSSVFDSSIPTGGVNLAPYMLVDASIAYAERGVRFLLAIDNVFDKDYQQFIGFPSRGRRARLEVSVEL